MTDTLLEIDFGIAPASSRGITEDLSLDDATKKQRRTVNGRLIDLSGTQFRKYRIKLEGSDMLPPALAGVWPGQIVTIKCISELCYAVGGTAERAAVEGSTRVSNGFVYYRPILQAMVEDLSQGTDEWGARVGWSLSLVEV
jgi:hypothetical protein